MSSDVRVLLVEESDRRAELVRVLMASDVMVVGEAGYGTEAVTAAQELKPDVIVVSVEEPLARSLRTIEALALALPDTGCVAISSLSDRDAMRKAMRAGVRDFLSRPFRPDELQRSIAEIAGTTRRRQQVTRDGDSSELHRGDLISVFGAKGGIGKTTVSVNLAVAIAMETKARTALVDLDTQMGDVALMLNFVPERSLADAVAVADRLEPELLQSMLFRDSSGIQVLASPPRVEDTDEITPERVGKVLDVMARTFDYIVVDTAPIFNDVVIAALDRSTLILQVTSQELPSLKRTRISLGLMLKTWQYPEDRVKLVINYPYSSNGVSNSDVEQTLDYPIFWKVPFDATASTCVNLGRPFVEARPNSKIARNLIDLGRMVSGRERGPARLSRGVFAGILAR
ncbi:MAG: AAA family ATPase [Chloroflexi bacterium]|nr:AAA family ATPase [Chloroflexota bacterium]